jgi:hypothetical protein
MKKILALILCVLTQTISSTSWAMADDLAMAATLPDTAHTILGGVVKSVSWADAAKGTKSEIVVKYATSRATINILVTPTTTLWDEDAKAIMPDKIVAKSKVNVIYLTTLEGVNEAKSIKILK